MSALVLVLSIVLFVILNAGTCIVFFKPDRLRFAEVPAWLLAVLAGSEARRRLLRIMDSRKRAEREEIRERVRRDAEAGERSVASPGASDPGLPGLAAIRAAGVPMAEAGRNLAAGLTLGLTSPNEARERLAEQMRLSYAVPLIDVGCMCGSSCDRVLWVEGRGRVCLTCEGSETGSVPVSVNGTIVQVPWPR